MSETEGAGESSPLSTEEPEEKKKRPGVTLRFTQKTGKLFTKKGPVYPGETFKVSKAEATYYLSRANIEEVTD